MSPGALAAAKLGPKASKRWRRRRRRLTRVRFLPFVDDFAMFGETYDATLQLADYTFGLLRILGQKVHPTKGQFPSILVGDHLGMILDFERGEFRAPTAKLKSIAVSANTLLCRASSYKR